MPLHAEGEGRLAIVGLGPGKIEYMTGRALEAIREAEFILGHSTYLEPLQPLLAEKTVLSSSMGKEVDRAKKAIDLARTHAVAIVSGGDAGIYGMASIVLEVLEHEGIQINVEIIPGVTAATAAASRAGSRLSGDFATISLSDLLTPLEVIEKRLDAVFSVGMPVVLYNPKSRGRPHNLALALEHAGRYLGDATRSRLSGTPCAKVKRRPSPRLAGLTSTWRRSICTRPSSLAGPRAGSGGWETMSKESSRRVDTTTNTYIDVGADTQEGYAISVKSRALAREVVGNATVEDRIRQRCSIAVGDFAMADLMRFCHDPVPAALTALAAGSPIITDIRMVQTGIQKKGHACEVICALDNGADIVKEQGITRSSAGFFALRDRIPGSIVVIGNAPSALLSLCTMIRDGTRPAVVIGTPVGFVNAAESKELLRTVNIPSISNEGTRGGTPVAVAAANECITIFIEGRKE